MRQVINNFLRKLNIRDINPLTVEEGCTTLTYIKPVSEWTIEERTNMNWRSLVRKDPIKGLEKRVATTIKPNESATLSEVFENASNEVTKIKFTI